VERKRHRTGWLDQVRTTEEMHLWGQRLVKHSTRYPNFLHYALEAMIMQGVGGKGGMGGMDVSIDERAAPVVEFYSQLVAMTFVRSRLGRAFLGLPLEYAVGCLTSQNNCE